INLAETAAWLIASLGRIIAAGDAGARLPQTLDEYAFMVQFGISPEMRRMHRIAGAALSRGDYRLLREKGIKSLADLQAIPREELANIINPESKLKRLFQEKETLTMEDTMNRISTVGTGMKFQSATLGLGPGFHPSAVELDGRYEGERYLVKIDNFPIRLTGKSFKYLVKLAHSRLVNGEGWMYKDDIEAGFNQARYLYRLKLEINRDGGCPWGIFENNRLGYYRLDIEPARIRLNLENLKNHPDYEIRCIADQLAPRLVS
ncbi:MAG: hypothetical protein NT002_09350, partial [candidate division Zixibacteria bacterium]|nr:hypothetical protein [candidate division Zixibacteria bacterium]